MVNSERIKFILPRKVYDKLQKARSSSSGSGKTGLTAGSGRSNLTKNTTLTKNSSFLSSSREDKRRGIDRKRPLGPQNSSNSNLSSKHRNSEDRDIPSSRRTSSINAESQQPFLPNFDPNQNSSDRRNSLNFSAISSSVKGFRKSATQMIRKSVVFRPKELDEDNPKLAELLEPPSSEDGR